MLIPPIHAAAQSDTQYEEISVYLMVQRVGGIEIPAVYHNQSIYLPVQEIFDFLKIKCTPSPTYDSITGFFIDLKSVYSIDKLHNKITYARREIKLKPDDMIRTETSLYLKSNYFGEVFGLECTFNFRSLSVTLNTKIELPVIRDMRLEFMRNNINRMKGRVKADTTLPGTHPFFRFGMADWSVIASQDLQGKSQTRLNLGLGSVIAGGEANVALQYYPNQAFSEREQVYLWRYVNNDHPALRQISAGKIASQSTSSIFSPVVGVQLTNAPTTYRRSFGNYTLSDYTEPDWAVELYVNNVLVDYIKADASGFFTFEVPLMYGMTNVLLRFYGPFGEEQSKQQTITIPYNFLPAKEFQYTVTGGVVEDGLFSRYSRASMNYGVARFLTVGGGVEYLSSVTAAPFMPYINSSIRIGSNLLFSGEYTLGVRGKAILNYRTPGNFQFELNYTRYDPKQTAVVFNYLEERKAVVSFPIRTTGFNAFSRLTLAQNILESTQFASAEWLLSGVLFGMSTNLTTYALLADLGSPYVYTNLTLGLRLPWRILFRPQAQFLYTGKQFMLVKAEMEKQFLKHGFLNLSFERNFITSLNNLQLGFRYEFGAAQTSVLYRRSNNSDSFLESARGSLLFDRKTGYTGFSNRTAMGRGGIVLIPFIDLDGNGHYDQGESRVLGLKINVNGGRVEQSKRDSVVRIFDLEPYVAYFIELDRFSFENIAWQIKLKSMSVVVDPNQFKRVEIPVSVMGEAAGMVRLGGKTGEIGQGRIIIDFYDAGGKYLAKVLTEQDGYFSYLGLPPGPCIARVDSAQMGKLNMTASPREIRFVIDKTPEGDVKDGLDFVIRTNYREEKQTVAADTVVQRKTETSTVNPVKAATNDSVNKVAPVKPSETDKSAVVSQLPFYSIQVAASMDFVEPSYFREKFKIEGDLRYYLKDGWYKYVTGQFKSFKEASSKMTELGLSGFVTKVDPSLLNR